MRNRFVLPILAFLLSAPLLHANTIPWLSGTFNNVSNFLTFSDSGTSPDGTRNFHLQINLTLGPPDFTQIMMCGNVVCYRETIDPITADVAAQITDAFTHVVLDTFDVSEVAGAVEFQDWFAPLPPDHHYHYHYGLFGRWNNGWGTAIGGFEDITPSTQVSQINVSTTTPEPSTLLSLASGFAFVLAGFKRRQ